MANPRQRRKARSSTHRPVSHSRRAKKILKKTPPIRGPKILQDSWDKTKTVRQNYAALGLVHTLNPLASGGSERDEAATTSAPQDHEMQPVASSSSSTPTAAAIPKGYGKIIRDSSGNVLRIELADDENNDEDPNQNGEDEQQQGLQDPQLDKAVISRWVTDLGGTKSGAAADSDVAKTLTLISSSTPSSGPRHTSDLETNYLTRLIAKHGVDDIEGMARDRRLNPEQRTVGELRRGIRRAALGR